METQAPKTCEYCGKPFEWTNPRQRFCNRSCKGANSGRKFEAANPERAKEIHKKAQEAKRERHRIYWHEYLAQNKERYSANRRLKYAENREEEAAKRKKWFWDNHQVSLETGRKAYYKSRDTSLWLVSLQSAKARAKKSGLEFSLTSEWATERWSGKCEITDIPFVISKRPSPFLYSPSIDRVRPELGYTPDNCRFVLFAVNAMKGAGSDADIVAIAEAIVLRISFCNQGLITATTEPVDPRST